MICEKCSSKTSGEYPALHLPCTSFGFERYVCLCDACKRELAGIINQFLQNKPAKAREPELRCLRCHGPTDVLVAGLCWACYNKGGAPATLHAAAPAPKPALKLEIGRYGNLVFGKVLEQDESLRNHYKQHEEVLASVPTALAPGGCRCNDDRRFLLVSHHYPNLLSGVLGVRGEARGRDYNAFSYRYHTLDDAKAAYESIKKLVARINRTVKISTSGMTVPMEIAE